MHHLHIFFLKKETGKKEKEKGKEHSKTQKIYKTNKSKKGERKKSLKNR